MKYDKFGKIVMKGRIFSYLVETLKQNRRLCLLISCIKFI